MEVDLERKRHRKNSQQPHHCFQTSEPTKQQHKTIINHHHHNISDNKPQPNFTHTPKITTHTQLTHQHLQTEKTKKGKKTKKE
jgi:hypothetical protein